MRNEMFRYGLAWMAWTMGYVLEGVVQENPESGLLKDGELAGAFAADNLQPGQGIDGIAEGSADPEFLEGLSGFGVNTSWGRPGEELYGTRFIASTAAYGIQNNYLHDSTRGRSIRFRTEMTSNAGSSSAGGFSTGAAVWVSGESGIFVASGVGGSANPFVSYTITFGRLPGTASGEELTGGFMEGTGGSVYGTRAAGFILSNMVNGSELVATWYGIDGRVLAVQTGSGGGIHPEGDEVFFGYDAGVDPAGWIHRIEITGRNGPEGGPFQNIGFDDFGYTPVELVEVPLPPVVTRPAEVWWGSYLYNEQLVDGGADGWSFVQEEMDGYLLHGAYWNYTHISPGPNLVGPKLAAIVNAHNKPVILEHLLAGAYPDIDSPFGYGFAGKLGDAAGFGSAISNIKRLMGYGFPRPDISTDYIMYSWKEAVRWHPEWTTEEFFTALTGNWESYTGALFSTTAGSPDRERYGWFRQWVERLADAFPGIRVTATNSPVYFTWEEDGQLRRELGGDLNNFFAWLKLERRGDQVTALYSGDGHGWAELGTGAATLGATARAGLLTASGRASLAEGRFDNIRVMPFFTSDIGRTGRGGKLTASSGVFELESQGDEDLHPGNSPRDAHFYTYREWSGDGTFTARLFSLTAQNPGRTNPAAECPTAGITLRVSTEADSPQVSLHANLANQLVFRARTLPGAGLAHVAGSGSPIANAGLSGGARYLRLKRAGGTVEAAYSNDGSNWTVIGSVGINLGTTYQVGLVADSQVSFEWAKAGFSDVSFLDNPVSTFSGASIGAAGAATSGFLGGSSTIRSAGGGVGGSADSMRFHSTELTGNGTILARLQYFADVLSPSTELNPAAQMGLALRADTTAGASQMAAVFTPQDGLKTLVRGAANATVSGAGSYGENECSIEPLGSQRRPLLHYFTGNDYLGTLHEAFTGEYADNYAGFTTDSPYAGYQKWGGSETHPDALLHRQKILLYEKWLQANGREHQFIANSAGGTDFNSFNTSTQAGRDGWDLLYKEQSLRSIQLHQLEGGRPDKVIFESWYAGPFTLVPEGKEGSFTNLVRDGIRYIKGTGQVLDLSIAPSGSSAFGGTGFQQQTPSGEQRVVSLPGTEGSVSEWKVRLHNAGAMEALPVLHAHETATSGWTIAYFINGIEVTGAITSAEGLPVTDSPIRGDELVAPGASVDLTVRLTTPANPSPGSILLRAFWNPQDPSLTHRDAVRIELYQPDPYSEWVSSIDWQGADSGESADPDLDKLSNLLEYALGGDPLRHDAAIAPVPAMSASRLALSFDRRADPALIYEVKASGDLSSWSTVWSSTGPENRDDRITVEDPISLLDQSPRFLRLSISRY